MRIMREKEFSGLKKSDVFFYLSNLSTTYKSWLQFTFKKSYYKNILNYIVLWYYRMYKINVCINTYILSNVLKLKLKKKFPEYLEKKL